MTEPHRERVAPWRDEHACHVSTLRVRIKSDMANQLERLLTGPIVPAWRDLRARGELLVGKEQRMRTTAYRAVLVALLVATVRATWSVTPVAAVTTTIFSNSFDSQSTGALVTGTGVNQFSGTRGLARLKVENRTVFSAPNALVITVRGGGSAYAYKQYRRAYTTYTLTLHLQLGAIFTVPPNHAVVLAQTVPLISSKVGKVDVTLPADNRIRLDYFDSAGRQHYLWGRVAVPRHSWHTVRLRETMGAGSGSLALLVDGTTVASRSNLDLGPRGVTRFAVGEEYASPGRGYAGNFYIDNVTATSTA
jgi:hypothetical protein